MKTDNSTKSPNLAKRVLADRLPKTYVLTVSEYFPKTHKKSGLETGFISKIYAGTKIHTIRGNYLLWHKRFQEIEKGNAILSLRKWEGKPYSSKQIEFLILSKSSGISLQKLEFYEDKDGVCSLKYPIINNRSEPNIEILAENDGLTYTNFKEWFKGYNLNEPMAIIHFTEFRY